MSSYAAALAWLSSRPPSSAHSLKLPEGTAAAMKKIKQEKLTTIAALLEACGNPQDSLQLVHVGGSKGKSTAAAAAAQTLQMRGFSTGLFTSPHVERYNERIGINGRRISNAAFARAVHFVRGRIESATRARGAFHEPTFFEVMTAAGLCAFADAGCEWAVIEVGIGGRYDTTNIIRPKLCIICQIEYEHTDILGKTIEEIASDKAGIIKSGVPVWIGAQPYPAAREIFAREARHGGAARSPIFFADEQYDIRDVHMDERGTNARVVARAAARKGVQTDGAANVSADIALPAGTSFFYKTPGIGRALLEDQVLAYTAVCSHLMHEAQKLPQKKSATKTVKTAAKKNIAHRAFFPARVSMSAKASLPARCELLHVASGDASKKNSVKKTQTVFLDGSHTAQSVRHACACIEHLFGKTCAVFGMIDGKSHAAVCDELAAKKNIFTRIFIAPVSYPVKAQKNSDVHTALTTALTKRMSGIVLCRDTEDALDKAFAWCAKTREALSVFGSFYLCGEVRRILHDRIITKKR